MAIGLVPLTANTTGSNNTAIGASAMSQNTTGGYNVGLGSSALVTNVSGSYNTAVGNQALSDVTNTANSYNSAFGAIALGGSSGMYNVGMGAWAGNSVTSGNGNVFIGYKADSLDTIHPYDNQVAIGWGARTAAANQLVFGGDGSDSDHPSIVQALPGKTATTDLGSSNKRWKNIYATNVDVTGSFTVNGSPISGGGAAWGGITGTLVDQTDLSTALGNKVATTTTVNGHALSGNVTVSASDLSTGTLPHAQLPTLLSADIPNNAANTSGTAAGLSAMLAVSSGGTGATSASGALTSLGAAPLASPTFTGTPAAPTATAGTNTTQLATTAFVTSAVSGKESTLTFNSPLSRSTNTISLGTVPVANGGTGSTSLTAGYVVLGNGTSALQAVAPGTSGNVLTSNGSTWVSSAAGGASLPSQTGNTGKFLTTNGSTPSWGAPSLSSDSYYNTKAGTGALGGLISTTGNNSAFGYGALQYVSTGTDNVGIGTIAGGDIGAGIQNTAIGSKAMSNASSNDGSNNVAIGYAAMYYNGGSNNVAVGTGAMNGFSFAGSSNTAVGGGTAENVTTGQYGVFLGYAADTADGTLSNQIAIGTGSRATKANQMVIGADGNTSYYDSVQGWLAYPVLSEFVPGANGSTNLGSTTNLWNTVYGVAGDFQGTVTASGSSLTSDGRLKSNQQPIENGLTTLMKLRPKTYLKHLSRFVDGKLALAKDGAEEAGFIAQELYEVLPMAAHAPADESKGIWTVSYNQVIPYTVKAVQELKAENDTLRSKLGTMTAELDTMKAELAEIKALLKR